MAMIMILLCKYITRSRLERCLLPPTCPANHVRARAPPCRTPHSAPIALSPQLPILTDLGNEKTPQASLTKKPVDCKSCFCEKFLYSSGCSVWREALDPGFQLSEVRFRVASQPVDQEEPWDISNTRNTDSKTEKKAQ
jgi:hypothetical protein